MRLTIKSILLAACLSAAVVCAGCGSVHTEDLPAVQEEPSQEEASSGQEENSAADVPDDQRREPAVVAVYVCGQVARPGVYELTPDSRVCDALEAAGGVSRQADAELVNQAAVLTDGMRLYIPSREETASMDRMAQEMTAGGTVRESAGSDPDSAAGAVNINTAGREELMSLSGIGESKADSIIRYREENGSFSRIEDIMNIRGIKEGVFEQIRDSITV